MRKYNADIERNRLQSLIVYIYAELWCVLQEFRLLHYAGEVTYKIANFLDKNNDLLYRDMKSVCNPWCRINSPNLVFFSVPSCSLSL